MIFIFTVFKMDAVVRCIKMRIMMSQLSSGCLSYYGLKVFHSHFV